MFRKVPTIFDLLVPRILSSAFVKSRLDILVADRALPQTTVTDLLKLDLLKNYLSELEGSLSIAVYAIDESAVSLQRGGVEHKAIGSLGATSAEALRRAVIDFDADLLLTDRASGEPLQDTVLVTGEGAEVLRTAEVFARGHDVPWSFAQPVYDQPWTTFYQELDSRFHTLLDFDERWRASGDDETSESIRVLVHTTFPNLAFAEDRVAFYDMQQRMAVRRRLRRQSFKFERNYFLGDLYMGIFAGIDQLAITTNSALRLGLAEFDVSASGRAFPGLLKEAYPALADLFAGATPERQEFLQRVKLLRHAAAHRGPLVPAIVYQDDREFTDAALDAKIVELGWQDELEGLPDGPIRDTSVRLLRLRAKLELATVLLDDAVHVRDRTGNFFVRPDPHGDFDRFIVFATDVLTLLSALQNAGGSATV
jgi:hypothetical protein